MSVDRTPPVNKTAQRKQRTLEELKKGVLEARRRREAGLPPLDKKVVKDPDEWPVLDGLNSELGGN